MERPTLEPWLRGAVSGVHPVVGALLRSLEHAREDLDFWTRDLTAAQLWRRPSGLASVGFQIRHIAGSVDRLMSYAQARPLDAAQLEALASEMQPGASRDELFAELDASFGAASAAARALDLSDPAAPRAIGRKLLPVPLAGLLVHIAEHTQRHTGQAITTSKLVRAASRPPA